MGLINLPAFLLGFPLETLAGLIAFRGIWAIYIHSNVRLPLGPLRVLIGAPELHHWHHDRDRDAGNYANISPLMDVIFGTYVCPDHEPEAFGVNEPTPADYLGQMIHPFRRGGIVTRCLRRPGNERPFHPCPTPGRRGIERSGPAPRPFRPASPAQLPAATARPALRLAGEFRVIGRPIAPGGIAPQRHGDTETRRTPGQTARLSALLPLCLRVFCAPARCFLQSTLRNSSTSP